MAEPLVTVEQFELYRRKPLSEPDAAAAEMLLDALSEAVRADTGQWFTADSSTVDLPGTGASWLVLPQQPVTAVAGVEVAGDVLAADCWQLRNGKLLRTHWPSCGCWLGAERSHRNRVHVWHEDAYYTVTFTHGYTQVPADVALFVCMAAAESLKGAVGLRSEQVGPYARSFLDNPPGQHVGLGLADLVRRYNLGGGVYVVRSGG